MSTPKDTLNRLLTLVQLIPAYPRTISTTALSDGLEQQGYLVEPRTIPNGKTLVPAAIDSEVWQQVTEALLSKQQLQVNYLSRTKGKHQQLLLNPIGMVSRTTIT